jgi:competence protein ComEC
VPRAGWLAVGGLIGAAALEAGAAGLLVPRGLWVSLALIAAAVALGAGADGRTRAAAMAAGIALVLARGLLAVGPGAPVTAMEAPSGVLTWDATVESVSAPSGGSQRAVVLATASAATPGQSSSPRPSASDPGPFRLWAQLPRYPPVAPGDRISFRGRVEPVDPTSGFGAYLERLGAAGTIQGTELAMGPAPEGIARWLEHVRRTIDAWTAAVLPEPQAGLATAIVIGLRDRVDRDVAAAFTSAGLSHVVAISGWNIALVGATVAAFLRRTPRRRRALVTVAAVATYTLLAGASPSVLRAALMAAIVLTARELGRPGQASAALGLAALAMLVFDPSVVTDAGYQLSVAATAGLVAWAPGISGRMRDRLPRFLPSGLVESLGVSFAAQAATLPIILLQFARLSLVAPVANLVAAPLVAPVMLAGVLAALTGALIGAGLPSLLLVPVTVLGSLVVGGLIAVAQCAAALPFASVDLPPPWPPLAAGLATLTLLVATSRRSRAWLGQLWGQVKPGRARRSAAPARPAVRRVSIRMRRAGLLTGVVLTAALLPFGLTLGARPDSRLHMVVLDVGQGDAILLLGDRGGRILVDTGPDPDRLLRLLDARIPSWDRRLDLLVLSHPHEDHVAGAALLLNRYRVGALAEPGMRGPGPGYAALQSALLEHPLPDRLLAAGDGLMLDDATLAVRWPAPGSVARDPADTGRGINDVSIVLDLRYGQRRFLLTGDAEDDVDPHLLAAGIGDTPTDVLKVAHHGSRTATSAALLDALRPTIAIISVGAGNRYGHPAPETLDRLKASGARTYRTDRDGSVDVSTDGSDLRVATDRAEVPVARAPAAAPTIVTIGADPRSGRGSTSSAPRPVLPADVPPMPGYGAALVGAGLPRIRRWPSRRGGRPPRSSSPVRRRPGSSPTAARSPKWPRSWPCGSPHAARPSIGGWSRPPPCSTTSTRSCRPTIRCGRCLTGVPALAG